MSKSVLIAAIVGSFLLVGAVAAQLRSVPGPGTRLPGPGLGPR